MREIKFRGKRKDNNEWVYGSLVTYGNQVFIWEKFTSGYIATAEVKRLFSETFIEVVPETVGQYTGLKDSKGVEIYGGSLIKDPQGSVGKVFYNKTQSGYLVNWHKKDGTWETDSCIGYGIVVGDIYTNPELLKCTE